MNRRSYAGIVIVVAGFVGCADENERLADYAMESARWQAEQSQTLVQADAASRQELATLQRELRADQAEIAQQYEALASNHTQWVQAHDRDAQAGSSILGLAFVLACLAPIVLAAGALFGQNDPPNDEEIDAVIHHQ